MNLVEIFSIRRTCFTCIYGKLDFSLYPCKICFKGIDFSNIPDAPDMWIMNYSRKIGTKE